MLALAASVLAGIAAAIASLDGDADIVPFFVGLTVLAGVEAWASREPFVGWYRTIARAVAVVWLAAAVWTGALLLWFAVAAYGSSRPAQLPEATYLGLTATVYHLVGLYGGAVLVVWSAFRPARFRRPSAASDDPASAV